MWSREDSASRKLLRASEKDAGLTTHRAFRRGPPGSLARIGAGFARHLGSLACARKAKTISSCNNEVHSMETVQPKKRFKIEALESRIAPSMCGCHGHDHGNGQGQSQIQSQFQSQSQSQFQGQSQSLSLSIFSQSFASSSSSASASAFAQSFSTPFQFSMVL
jgi:hypothetical protein